VSITSTQAPTRPGILVHSRRDSMCPPWCVTTRREHRKRADARHFARRVSTLLTLFALTMGCGGSSTGTAPTSTTPVFQGFWVGNWVKQACTENGLYAGSGFCASQSGGTVTINIMQTGNQASGTAVIGGQAVFVGGQPGSCTVLASCGPATVAGAIGGDGALTLTGAGSSSPMIVSWRSQIVGNTQTGSFVFTATTSGGSAQITASLSNVVRM
jgi:hypothetical protein